MNLYYCIVENINDPLKIGRVQIRIMGKNTENRTDETQLSYLPVDDLLWADCLGSSVSANISGICDFGVPANGSLCICSFIDPEEQRPIVLGTISRIVNADNLPDFTTGFSDPNSINPKESMFGESQISRLARNENINDTIIKTKKDNVKTGISCNGNTWDEPQTEYNTIYPHNRVIETESGHIIELDSTSGSERIHIYHKSGSFDEYFPEGTKVENIKNKKYEIIIDDRNIFVGGDLNVHIAGDEFKEVVGDIKIKSSGKISVSNGTYSLYGMLSEIITRIKSLQTFGSPTNHTVLPADQSLLDTLKDHLDSFMEA